MKATGITRHLSSALSAARDLLALTGAAAILAFLVLSPLREPVAKVLPIVLPMLPSVVMDQLVAAPVAAAANSHLEQEQQAVAEFIAKRYRVAEDVAANFVGIAYRAGDQYSVDPLLILAVMAIESRYNPVAESVAGARGLMQIIPRYHLEKFEPHGGEQAMLEPQVNIYVGAQILREYYRRFGDQEAALQMYNGALDDATAQYTNKVLAEKARLEVLRIKTRKTGQSA